MNSIKKLPFKGKSPELELNIDLVTEHAKAAYRYHIIFALTAVVLSFLGLISYSNTILSCMFSIPAICILLLKPTYDKYIALNNFSKKSFNPYYNLNSSFIQGNKIKYENNIGQNVIIFGGYSPFLGAGNSIKNGSKNFVIDLLKSRNERDGETKISTDLYVEELYNAVENEIERKKLPHVSSSYVLFADGKQIDKVDLLLPTKLGEPIENLDLKTLFSEGHKDMFKDYRAYMTIRYHDNIKSTLLSAFLRFSEVGKQIFAEYSFYFLPPIDESRFDIDKMPINKSVFSLKTGIITFGLIIAYISLVPHTYFIIPLVLFLFAIRPIIKLLGYKFEEVNTKAFFEEKIRRGESHNYGLFRTFRETIANTNNMNYFKTQDIVMMQNSIEMSILNSVADLLDAKGLDSSFLRENIIQQVSQNLLMVNGAVIDSQFVVGDGNQISSQKKENT